MAMQAVKKAVEWLRKWDSIRPLIDVDTRDEPLPGAVGLEDPTSSGVRDYARLLAHKYSLHLRTADHLAQTYGIPNPDRTDTDGDGFVDDCDSGLEYLPS